MMRVSIVFLFMILIYGNAKAQLVINEFMQSNIDCIMDDLNEFPDSWVELYNAGESPVNLKENKIGVENNVESAWLLPDSVVEPKSFIVVYCDKSSQGLHTDFRLDSGKGGALYLFNGNELIDKIEDIKKQPAPNISFGRKNDGINEWGYQQIATPNHPNCGSICSSDQLLPQPIFNIPGFVTTTHTPVCLSLSLPTGVPEGTRIFYTLDGSEPTKGSFLYFQPIQICNTCIVRAKLICDGYLSPISTTHSYIYFPRRITLPIISISTNEDYLYNPLIGIMVDGSYTNEKENFQYNWRRPINFEFFSAEDSLSSINQLCEMRIMGGKYTRRWPIKSLAIYANKRFGKKHLKYSFFQEDKPEISNYKSIMLRNSGNDFYDLYMLDAIVQRSMGTHADLDWQAWQPTVVFVNGKYSGILNIRERSNEDNIYSNYNGLEDIDMIENWNELKIGTFDEYLKFRAFYEEGDHSLDDYSQYLDYKEFQNLMIMNLFFNNLDFPSNNIVAWRPRMKDGVWRFIAKDCDFGLGHNNIPASYNTIEWLYNNDYDSRYNWGNTSSSTLLFRKLMEINEFKNEFIEKAAIYTGDFLSADGIKKIWKPMFDEVRFEYDFHQELYDTINVLSYEERFNNMNEWVNARCVLFNSMLNTYYNYGTLVPLRIHSNVDSCQLFFNNVKLSNPEFDGCFYAGRKVELKYKEGVAVTGWSVFENKNGSIVENFYNEPTLSLAMPECDGLEIFPIYATTNMVNESLHNWTYNIINKDLVIDNLLKNQLINLYSLQGIKIYSCLAKDHYCSIPLNGHLKNYKFLILKIGNRCAKIMKK